MKQTRNDSIWRTISLCLALLSLFYCFYLTSLYSDEIEANGYAKRSMRQSLSSLEERMVSLEGKLFPGESFLEAREILYGEYDAQSQTIPLSLTLTPIEDLRTAGEALLHVNGNNLVLKPEGASYSIRYHAPIFEAQRITAVTWREGESAQTFPLYWEIHPAD